MQSQFEPLICTKRIDETADTTTFEFKKLDDGLFEYKAGQFLTFEVDVAGEVEYRAYSLSSTPSKPESVAVTIKRVAGGKVSNYLLDHLQAGIALPVMAPAGEFTIENNQVTPDILLMSAGSGITPCMSMARWLLDTEQKVNIHFIYSARSETDIIMFSELESLNQQHNNFQLSFILEETDNCEFIAGRLDVINFTQLVSDVAGKTIFTCGPTAYMQVVESLAESRGFDMDLFHKESFVPEVVEEPEQSDNGVKYQVVAPQYGKSFTINAGKTLLDALEEAGVPIIGACRSGVCGSCKCKVTGNVESSSSATLSAEQIQQGYVLSCSSKVTSDAVVEL
ncbi:hybrid-cluster NAD(P)-dependent oxidoreductase [Psychromonas sp. Urea-02u-13]|uniref:hybrid-cluster NAD(P)-dependent oxidoreductase n=1 Tax=Psychromonas sp. Urea-02u-13 TaxID=2058326 RepID=UPI000C32853F|nr:hybrid-cluster NAD(P)-dependent oxidoreductase [Psychromonas sp. Urea-02u-13]PKG40872.1 hybrid-cluster NAD(P)-dependent oxidoreductase [Psychromonas sp. Urea-02u-13]